MKMMKRLPTIPPQPLAATPFARKGGHYYLLALLGLCFFLAACDRRPSVNFQTLTRPVLPHYFLACPKDYCTVKPTVYSPVYSVSAEDLFNAFNQMAAQDASIRFVYTMPESGQFELTVQSRWLPLPQDVSIQFIALSAHQSTLAVYSQSRYGFYDFGENKRCIESWFAKLAKMTA